VERPFGSDQGLIRYEGRSAAVPAAVVGASRPHPRGQDALATAGKMPALPKDVSRS